MTRNSTLIYILNNTEEEQLIDVDQLEDVFIDYEKVQKHLNEIIVKAPDLIVNNILEYSKKH